jgi:tetratricopeptide (TPR) repeat protein
LEEYEKAIEIYKSMEADEDILTNIAACESLMSATPSIKEDVTFSTLLNLGMHFSNVQEYEKAIEILNKAASSL